MALVLFNCIWIGLASFGFASTLPNIEDTRSTKLFVRGIGTGLLTAASIVLLTILLRP